MSLLERKQVRDSVLACTNCSLCHTGNGPIPFSGPTPSPVAVSGEAPGKEEDAQGRPFVGVSGRLARSWLAAASIDPDSVAWLNVVSCFPNRTPTSSERESCRINLQSQLELIRPSFILVLGGIAVGAFIPNIRIGEIRGRWWRLKDYIEPEPWALATWHPAAVLRNKHLASEVRSDIDLFRLVCQQEIDPELAGECVKCSTVAENWDEWGIAWCWKHYPPRMKELTKPRRRQRARKEDKVKVEQTGLFS